MGFLDKIKGKATTAVDQHGDKIAGGIDKAADAIDKKTGGKHHDKHRQGPQPGQGRARQAGRKERRHQVNPREVHMNADTLHRTTASAPPVDPPGPSEPATEPGGSRPNPVRCRPTPSPSRSRTTRARPHAPEPEPDPGGLPPPKPPFQVP